MSERTFAMIKPQAVANGHVDAIVNRIEKEGFTVVEKQQLQLTREKAEELYAIHSERSFFQEMLNDITSGPVVIMVLEKDDAIKAWRDLMGATNPADAAEGTLRKEFGESIGHNAVHGSDSPESAATEIGIFRNLF